MKGIFLLAALTAALGAPPSFAQQGPAGVPGVFGLAESVTSPATPPAPRATQAQQPLRDPTDCSRAKSPEQCQRRQDTRKQALEACQGKTGTQRKQCLSKPPQGIDCKQSSDPARCTQHQKARKLCAAKIGEEHRQCLRDNLAPTK